MKTLVQMVVVVWYNLTEIMIGFSNRCSDDEGEKLVQKCWIKEESHPLAPCGTSTTPYTAVCTDCCGLVEYPEQVYYIERTAFLKYSTMLCWLNFLE